MDTQSVHNLAEILAKKNYVYIWTTTTFLNKYCENDTKELIKRLRLFVVTYVSC